MSSVGLPVNRVKAAEDVVRLQILAINCWLVADGQDTGALYYLAADLVLQVKALANEKAGAFIALSIRPKETSAPCPEPVEKP